MKEILKGMMQVTNVSKPSEDFDKGYADAVGKVGPDSRLFHAKWSNLNYRSGYQSVPLRYRLSGQWEKEMACFEKE